MRDEKVVLFSHFKCLSYHDGIPTSVATGLRWKCQINKYHLINLCESDCTLYLFKLCMLVVSPKKM